MAEHKYNGYHFHSQLSNGITNIDSITDFREYINKAKECGMTAFGLAEHGTLFEHLHKKEEIEKAGMKYIHAIEAYLTEDLFQEIDGEQKQIRDNYHCVLIAKNFEGVQELNKLVSNSFNREDGHYYYVPRITFNELFATSDNIILTTACLGGVLNKGTPQAIEKFLSFMRKNRDRCYLEIQHHNIPSQIEYNQFLYSLSKDIDIPLIVGTDTHALDDRQMEGRRVLQSAKDVLFSDESEWDLTFKTPDELIEAYKKQNSIPMEVVYEAMENSIEMTNRIESYELDYSPKYPKLYDNSEEVFKQKVNEGVKWRKITDKPNYQEYVDRIHYEYETYKHNGAIDFILLEEDYKRAMREKGVRYGYSRGSVSGSIIAYLLGVTEVDSIKYNLNFERFMNTERVSLADVDTDWGSEDREIVKDYLYSKDGLYCCDIVTFNTIALKGAIKDVCRGLHKENIKMLPEEIRNQANEWDKKQSEKSKANRDYIWQDYPDELSKEITKHSKYKEIPTNYLTFSEQLIDLCEKDESSTRKKYERIFYYVDLINGVVVSVGNHPAGCVVSPFPVDEWFGTFTTKTDNRPISLLNMKEIDSLNFVKLDILGLDNVKLIYQTCDAANLPYLTPDNVDGTDINVWNSIKEDTTCIFQWESDSATAYLRQLFSTPTVERIREQNPNFSYMDLLSIGNGAIRPAGESYRNKLSNGEFATYGNEALDEFMKPTLGWMVYQETIIEFLHRFCGYTMGEADVVRRHFAKKTGTEKDIPAIKEGFAKTMLKEYGMSKEESDKIIVNFIKVIEDASLYLFSKNHSDPYSWIGYICGYLRYYYPLEFITSALNIFADNEEKTLAIIEYARKHKIKISPIKFRYSVAQYGFDKESNMIFKGIASIKYMNSQIAEELSVLGKKQYENFIELLFDIKNETTVNSRQLKILIELDFFEEFGDANKLLKECELFDAFANKVQIAKSKIEKYKIDTNIVEQYANKETEKMFTGVDSYNLLIALSKEIKVPNRGLKEIIKSQIDHLGYLSITDDKYASLAVVSDINTRFSPRLKMYSLKNGTVLDCKIQKRIFNRTPLKKKDIVKVLTTDMRKKTMKNAEGKWEEIDGTSELWITRYVKVENL